jgi:phosphomannomutase
MREFASSHGTWLKNYSGKDKLSVAGRDARISGPMIHNLANTLIGFRY